MVTSPYFDAHALFLLLLLLRFAARREELQRTSRLQGKVVVGGMSQGGTNLFPFSRPPTPNTAIEKVRMTSPSPHKIHRKPERIPKKTLAQTVASREEGQREEREGRNWKIQSTPPSFAMQAEALFNSYQWGRGGEERSFSCNPRVQIARTRLPREDVLPLHP